MSTSTDERFPLPRASQKVLCNLIEDHGGIDKLCNKTNVSQQSQHLSKLLDKHTDLFGIRGDPRCQKARRLINYWYSNYYKIKQERIVQFLKSLGLSLVRK